MKPGAASDAVDDQHTERDGGKKNQAHRLPKNSIALRITFGNTGTRRYWDYNIR